MKTLIILFHVINPTLGDYKTYYHVVPNNDVVMCDEIGKYVKEHLMYTQNREDIQVTYECQWKDSTVTE